MPDLTKPKILAVEDHRTVQEGYKAWAESLQMELLQAYCLEEALALVEAHPDIAAVIVDGWVPYRRGEDVLPHPAETPLTAKLIIHLRGRRCGFTGPIVVAAGEPIGRRKLMEAGGTVAVEKEDAIRTALTRLGLPTRPR